MKIVEVSWAFIRERPPQKSAHASVRRAGVYAKA